LSIVLDMVVVLLGWRTWKSRDPDPVRGGRLAACRWSPCAARGQTKNRGPRLAHGSWFLRLGGIAAGQLPRGGHRAPATGIAERRIRAPGEHRVAQHSTTSG